MRPSSLSCRSFVVIEYVMLRGVNDTAGDAQRLSELLADVYCMVNLIVFNPHDGTQVRHLSRAEGHVQGLCWY